MIYKSNDDDNIRLKKKSLKGKNDRKVHRYENLETVIVILHGRPNTNSNKSLDG